MAEFCYKINDEAQAIAKKQGIELHTNVQSGHEVEAIVSFAEHGNLTFWSSAASYLGGLIALRDDQ